MASEDLPTRRTSSRISSRPVTENLPAATTKRKPVDAPKAVKKAKAGEVVAKDAPDSKEGAVAPKPAVSKDSSSSKILSAGSSLPAITLKTEDGKEVDIAGLKKAVIFTYPKANTPGCTTQACLFRDEYSKFQEAGFKVFGLSSDNEGPLANWKRNKGFAYSLLSDPKRQLIGPLTGSSSSTIRSHFVIDADGKLAHSAIKVKPVESWSDALKVAKGL